MKYGHLRISVHEERPTSSIHCRLHSRFGSTQQHQYGGIRCEGHVPLHFPLRLASTAIENVNLTCNAAMYCL